jgi:hypothetical protein
MIRTVCFVQVNSFFPYLPSFIAHHERIFDKIVFIVHNSGFSLPPDTDNISRVYLDEFSYFLAAGWGYAFEKRGKEYDFAFFMDSDEFLNVSCDSSLRSILFKYNLHCAFYLHWRPVVPPINFDGEFGIDELDAFKCCPSLVHTKKVIYNVNRNKYFSPIHGNHVYNGKKKIFSLFRGADSELCLLHFPFLSFEALKDKIITNPDGNFRHKILDSAPYLSEKYGLDWFNSDISREDFVYLCVNYRERDQRKHLLVQEMDLIPLPDLKFPRDRIEYWTKSLASLGFLGRRTALRPGEASWLSEIREKRINNSADYLEQFHEQDRQVRFKF